MKVAFVHSFYRSATPSGENVVVRNDVASLRRSGHDVRLFSVSSDDLVDEPFYTVRAAATAATGLGREPTKVIRSFAPDVVHVHNLFPNIGEQWLASLDVPVVRTLHNFRTVCANGLLFRDGDVCQLCVGRRVPIPAVRHRCYRGSMVATVPVAVGIARRSLRRTWQQADHLVVLLERVRDVAVDAGADPERISLWANHLPESETPPVGNGPRRGLLFVGRVEDAKGVADLVRRWRGPRTLTVMGGGPQLSPLRSEALDPTVRLVGQRSRAEVSAAMTGAEALVFTSKSFEGAAAPLVYIEALAHGLPVVATGASDVPRLVEEQGTGRSYESIGELVDAMAAGTDGLPGVDAVRAAFDEHHSEMAAVSRAVGLYSKLTSSDP